MKNQQMGMPAEMAAPGPSPEQMAIYDQLRQGVSPQEFSNEMLAGASQVDPQAVAEFTQELQGLDMPPEVLDALNDVVDEILANPERYAELRAQYMEQGLPEDILPEQFDPQFFAALNMAVDQMIAAPTGVQAFAQGGIAELKPIAKAIASYGRNGDTMLAHITPAEARMLRRRGGSGTINPDTGLPEFFLKKLWKGVGKALKSVGNAVKKFASSTVGRLVTTVALGFFLGPAAASFMGIGSAAGVAAVSGFVGSAGSTLLAGGNLKDALKAGAIGGLTAGAGAGIMGGADAFAAGSYTGPTTVGGQFDKFKAAITPNAAPTGNLAPVVDAPAPVPGTGPQGIGPSQMPVPDADPMGSFIQQNEAARAAANTPAAIPGILRTYGPAAVAGLGAMSAFGGFDTKPVQGGEITQSLMKPVTQRIQEKGTQRQMYMQGLPGVVYDEYGAPVYGQSTRLPTYDVPDYNSGGFDMPGQGIMNLPSIYIPPPGSIGSRSVAQPYNNADMYSNLVPRGYDEGGEVTSGSLFNVVNAAAETRLPSSFNWEQYVAANPDLGRAGIDTRGEAETHWLNQGLKENRALNPGEGAQREANRVTTLAEQKAARDAAAQQKAMRRAAGSGSMYANINAGLSALAPETNPMDASDTAFGGRNRTAQLATLQQTYAPMLQNQRNALAQQATALGQPAPNIPSPYTVLGPGTTAPVTPAPVTPGPVTPGPVTPGPVNPGPAAPTLSYFQQNPDVAAAYLNRGTDPNLASLANATPEEFAAVHFQKFGQAEQRTAPGAAPPPPGPSLMNMGGIAGLAQGGYPRRNGQISGPGTEKSDSIPAMLSDGEFVMTAKAVRGAGKGSRRAGAKQMYKLMHQLEKNAERG